MEDTVFPSIKEHLYTLIILHGMYESNESLLGLVNYLQKNNCNLKIILPNAPKRDINWPSGIEKDVNSWYNYYTRYDGKMEYDIINETEFYNQVERINKIIDTEINVLKNPKKILIAGISQGGTLALHIGLTNLFELGGIIGIHTLFLKDMIKDLDNINNIPIFLLSGKNDDVYNYKFQRICAKKIIKNIIKWKVVKKLEHCDYYKNENKLINKYLNFFIKN